MLNCCQLLVLTTPVKETLHIAWLCHISPRPSLRDGTNASNFFFFNLFYKGYSYPTNYIYRQYNYVHAGIFIDLIHVYI